MFGSQASPEAVPEILQRNPVVTGHKGRGAKENLLELFMKGR